MLPSLLLLNNINWCVFTLYFTEKIKRLEGLLTKCKESIKANKQKTTALTEVKESLANQGKHFFLYKPQHFHEFFEYFFFFFKVEEKEVELNDVKSQLLNTQSVLSTAQIELDSLRNKGQQEELQIAEIKMMMHQVNYL